LLCRTERVVTGIELSTAACTLWTWLQGNSAGSCQSLPVPSCRVWRRQSWVHNWTRWAGVWYASIELGHHVVCHWKPTAQL